MTPDFRSKLRAFAALSALGLLGAASLVLVRDRLIAAVPPEAVAAAGGPYVLTAISLLQPILLVTLAAVTGLVFAPRLALRSLIVERIAGRSDQPAAAPTNALTWSIAAGATAAALIIAGEAAFSPWTGHTIRRLSEAHPPTLAATASGVLYGGIAEEIMMRWGLLTLLAWTMTRLGAARRTALAIAILVTALLFGLAHLPAMAQLVELTPAITVRTVLLNAGPGVLFGILYVRFHLEAAMTAHASTHLFLFVLASIGLS